MVSECVLLNAKSEKLRRFLRWPEVAKSTMASTSRLLFLWITASIHVSAHSELSTEKERKQWKHFFLHYLQSSLPVGTTSYRLCFLPCFLFISCGQSSQVLGIGAMCFLPTGANVRFPLMQVSSPQIIAAFNLCHLIPMWLAIWVAV